jgi:hypothetical protein
MKRTVYLSLLACFFCACSSMDLPSVEESNRRIRMLQRSLVDAERPLNILQQRYRTQRDLATTLRLSAVNRIARALAAQRTDDLVITFLPTRPLLEERKSMLGIAYVNRLDIDSGRVTLDLRRFEFISGQRHALDAVIALEGEGRIAVSGRYTGLSASASPRIRLTLHDTVRFDLSAGPNGGFILTPRPRRVMLRTVFRVSLLGWDVPWSEDIPLEIHNLLPALSVPSMFEAALRFPVPAASYSVRNYDFHEIPLLLDRSLIDLRDGILMYHANVRIGG